MWEAGSDPVEDGRLYATVEVGGSLHHLEAIPVYQHPDYGQSGVTEISENILGELHAAFGAEGAFHTVEINGQEYAVFMSPFCQ
jgi:hypothetical protein